ncbi:hypothetical protein SUSAZ_01020 [Sulfolobus acidocaldarius SUSAZ]|nr:hypothetical protein SUSAZ_01020 [Sulfolobus acidocaldarius SUSAZ]
MSKWRLLLIIGVLLLLIGVALGDFILSQSLKEIGIPPTSSYTVNKGLVLVENQQLAASPNNQVPITVTSLTTDYTIVNSMTSVKSITIIQYPPLLNIIFGIIIASVIIVLVAGVVILYNKLK